MRRQSPNQEPDFNTVRYFLEKERRNPGYLGTLATKLWDEASDDERIVVMAVQTTLFESSLEERSRIAQASMLVQFLRSPAAIQLMQQEKAELDQLESSLFGDPES